MEYRFRAPFDREPGQRYKAVPIDALAQQGGDRMARHVRNACTHGYLQAIVTVFLAYLHGGQIENVTSLLYDGHKQPDTSGSLSWLDFHYLPLFHCTEGENAFQKIGLMLLNKALPN